MGRKSVPSLSRSVFPGIPCGATCVMPTKAFRRSRLDPSAAGTSSPSATMPPSQIFIFRRAATVLSSADVSRLLLRPTGFLTGILHESFFPATHPGQPLPGGVFRMLRRLQVSNGRGMPQLSAPVLMAASRGNADFLCTLPVKHNDGPAQAYRSSSASAHSLRSRLFEPVSRLRRAVLLV